jgi:hypothetical protein
MNFGKKFKFDTLDENTINYINNIANSSNDNILIEIPNTKGINSDLIRKLDKKVSIRVAGGYTDEVVNNMRNVVWNGTSFSAYDTYYNSVIYTKNELVSIIEELEKIESRLDSKWTDFEKFASIYTYLKSDIFYDPDYETKNKKGIIGDKDMRSLRGLISKNAVCAGYAIILKEILDRQGIKCDYADGNGHAWNIVNMDGKDYGIDLTWDNTQYRAKGNMNSSKFFGQSPSEFARCHIPRKFYKHQNYASTLSKFNSKAVEKVMKSLSRELEYSNSTYVCTRSDKTQFMLGQAGEKIVNGIKYYRYIYCDIDSNGKKLNPIILYSESNVLGLVNAKNFKDNYPKDAFKVMLDILFSKENINDSLNRGTSYIGKYRKGGNGADTILVSSVKEIKKPDNVNKLFKTSNSKTLVRSDGTRFVLVRSNNLISTPYGYVYKYIVYEMLKNNNKDYVKKNTIFTEMDLFNDNRRDMVDKFLSRRRLDNIMLRSGGYVGRYDANGNLVNNPDMFNYFKMNNRIDENGKMHVMPNIELIDFDKLPSLKVDFKTLHDYAMKYSVVYNSSKGKYYAKDISTGKIVDDDTISNIAILANMWLSYAGTYSNKNDKRSGEISAFTYNTFKIYEIFLNSMINDITKNGVINTVDLFKNVLDKYGDSGAKIIVSMFSSPRNCKLINNIICSICNVVSKDNEPVCLYSLEYAKKIINNNKNSDEVNRGNNGMSRIDKIKEYYNSVSEELSDIDKSVYNALINLVDDDNFGKDAINTLDGYLHNVIANKKLAKYFTGKDNDIINSFVLPSGITGKELIDVISKYNGQIVSINFFANRIMNSKAKVTFKEEKKEDKKEDKKEEKKDKKRKEVKKEDKKEGIIVKIKNIPDKLKEKANKKKASSKNVNVLKRLKKYLDKKIDDMKNKKGRSR